MRLRKSYLKLISYNHNYKGKGNLDRIPRNRPKSLSLQYLLKAILLLSQISYFYVYFLMNGDIVPWVE